MQFVILFSYKCLDFQYSHPVYNDLIISAKYDKLTSFPAVIIPRLSPSENITEESQSRPSSTAIPRTAKLSASSSSNSHCFFGEHLKYKEFCERLKKTSINTS